MKPSSCVALWERLGLQSRASEVRFLGDVPTKQAALTLVDAPL